MTPHPGSALGVRSPLARILLTALAVAAIAATGVLANVVLLGHADRRHDPIGKLTPRAEIARPATPDPSQESDGDHAETDEADD